MLINVHRFYICKYYEISICIYTFTDTSVIASTSRKRQKIDLEGTVPYVCTYVRKAVL